MASQSPTLFGMTILGGDAVRQSSAFAFSYDFHLIDAQVYTETFDKHLLGDSDIAQTLEVSWAKSL